MKIYKKASISDESMLSFNTVSCLGYLFTIWSHFAWVYCSICDPYSKWTCLPGHVEQHLPCETLTALEGISQKRFGSTELLMLKCIWAPQTTIRLVSLSPLISQFELLNLAISKMGINLNCHRQGFNTESIWKLKLIIVIPVHLGWKSENECFTRTAFLNLVIGLFKVKVKSTAMGIQPLLCVSTC